MIALAAALLFTLPSSGQNVYSVPSDGEDSIHVECSGGPPIHTLEDAYLWQYPKSGGGWRIVDSLNATGREGQQDSFPIFGPGFYYVTTRNNAGVSCAGNVVYVADSTVTGVPTDEAQHGTPVSIRLFDVSGRLVQGHRASGVYFKRERFRDGFIRTRRVVLLR